MNNKLEELIKKQNSVDYMESEINNLLKEYDIFGKACDSNSRTMKILEKSLKDITTYSWALSLIAKYYGGINCRDFPRVILSTNLIRVAYHVGLRNFDSRCINEMRVRIAESFIGSAVDLLVPLLDRSELLIQINEIRKIISIHNAFLKEQFYHPQIWTVDDWKYYVENNPEAHIIFWTSGLIMSDMFAKQHDLFKETFIKSAETQCAKEELASWKEFIINNKPSLFRSFIFTKYQGHANIKDIEKSIYQSDELIFLVNTIDTNVEEFGIFIKKYFGEEDKTATIKNIIFQYNKITEYSKLRRRQLM